MDFRPKKKKNKKVILNPKTMGVDIDKNEYHEIILSNSAHPESGFQKKHTN